jgi:hypothetical protein
MSDRDRDLAQFFIDRPADQPRRLTLLELIDAYAEATTPPMREGWTDLRTEIGRRLTAVQDFHGTEATRIRAILETGEDKAWWKK